LKDNEEKLEQIAEKLMSSEIIERDELLEIMGMEVDKPLDTPETVIAEEADKADMPDAPEPDDPFDLFPDDDTPPSDGEVY